MAVKVVHVSDISGKEADEQSLGQLVVHEHPEYADLPVTLEVLPEEVEQLQGASRFVTVEWIAPGARRGERMVVSLDDFNLLAGAGVMESAVQDALIAKHRSRPRSSGTGGGGGAAGGVRSAASARAGRRSTTPPPSTPASPTAAASPRPRRNWSARTSTRSTSASARPASARSTPATRPCATATAWIDVLPV